MKNENKPKPPYVLVVEPNGELFQQQVAEKMKEGYGLQGDTRHAEGIGFYQAMVPTFIYTVPTEYIRYTGPGNPLKGSWR